MRLARVQTKAFPCFPSQKGAPQCTTMGLWGLLSLDVGGRGRWVFQCAAGRGEFKVGNIQLGATELWCGQQGGLRQGNNTGRGGGIHGRGIDGAWQLSLPWPNCGRDAALLPVHPHTAQLVHRRPNLHPEVPLCF